MQTAEEKLSGGDALCPRCHGPFKFHGTYSRHFLDEKGDRHDGWVAQCCCDTCNEYPSLIPDFIMPYKHYEAAVIESAILEVEENGSLGLNSCPADDSTVRRWVNQFQERGARAVGWLLGIIYTLYGEYLSTLELVDKGLLKQLARLARKFAAPGTGSIIGRVNVILTRHNSGFL